MTHRVSIAVFACVAVLAAGCVASCANAPPERPFPPLDGPYNVGIREFDLVDASRSDPFTRDEVDRRRLTVQVWYPTRAPAGDARYLPRPDEHKNRFEAEMGAAIKTNASRETPIVAGTDVFPVLIYVHGFGANRQNATFAVEQLVSRGYVVLAAEHFGPGSPTIRYLDGTSYLADALLPPRDSDDPVADTRGFEAYLGQLLDIWSTDVAFLVTQAQAGRFDFLSGHTDVQALGVFGTSLGGAVALDMARDPRVRAAINFDGTMFGSVIETGANAPVMFIHHDYAQDIAGAPAQYADFVRASIQSQSNNIVQAQARSRTDWHVLTIPGSEHLDYSDYPLLTGADRAPGLLPVARVQSIVNAFSLAFFDEHLKSGSGGKLEAVATASPEARFAPLFRKTVSANLP